MHFFDSVITTVAPYIEFKVFLQCLGGAFVCGLISALTACVKNRASRSFLVSLAVLPMIVTTVILMVNGSVGTGIAVMGAFSLIRFRSVPGKARDIAAIFMAMAAGLTCACGFVGIAVVFTAIVGLLMVLLSFLPVGSDRYMELHITIPESLNFSEVFTDLFKQYLLTCRLVRARTTNMGSMYKLMYHVRMKKTSQMQEFIDALRCRNGNLEISLCDILNNEEAL